MARHRLALIGLGMAVVPHAKSLLDLADRVEVAAAFSRTEARRRAFAQNFPFPLSDDLEAILADRSIDILAILTPPNTHLDLVRRAAAARKHVLLEKPVEITTTRAVAAVRACREAGVTLGVVLQHRFRPAAQELAAMLRGGTLGALVGASAAIRNWRPQSYYDQPGRGTKARDGGGVLLTQGIHTLDLMLSLAGPVAEVTGYAATTAVHRMETEDMVCAAMRFANGALGTIDATTTAFPGFPERIELVGRLGSAVLAANDLTIFPHDGPAKEIKGVGSGGGTGADPMAFPHDWHRNLLADFLEAVDRKGEPRISGWEALRVHCLIDALLTTATSGRPTKVQRPDALLF